MAGHRSNGFALPPPITTWGGSALPMWDANDVMPNAVPAKVASVEKTPLPAARFEPVTRWSSH